MIPEEVKQKYAEVKTALESAVENSASIQLTGEKENVELSAIKDFLANTNTAFKEEIDKLENSSEWDKFCVAFFGETNAGKSTIIESLRIIYDEESRREEALAQENAYHQLLMKHCENYQELADSLKEVNTALKNAYVEETRIENTPRKKNYKWLFYPLVGAIGVAVGILIAKLGMIV